jgi:anti-sigma regulatory factor (Ser/Thr protein kinase)
MIESLRAFGYSTQSAIADLIDNSISAGARNVWVTFLWDGDNSHVIVRDDGRGMDPAALRNAMRPGSRNPLEERDAGDLGRFGLGLKTASFSQCRRLTVASRTDGTPVEVRRWDLVARGGLR